MSERPWTFDPFAWGYYKNVFSYLQPRKGSEVLNSDLLERLRACGEAFKNGDNTPVMTTRRVSWACYVASNIVLERLDADLAKNLASPEDRPVLTYEKLLALETALREAVKAANVAVAELAMTTSGRDASQVQSTSKGKLRVVVARDLELIGRALAYFKEVTIGFKEKLADITGEDFFYFLLDADKSSDELVAMAERMSELRVA